MMTVTWKDSASGCAEVPTAVGYFRFHTRLSQVDGDWLFGGGETERVKASGVISAQVWPERTTHRSWSCGGLRFCS